jgi:hypothetical protein
MASAIVRTAPTQMMAHQVDVAIGSCRAQRSGLRFVLVVAQQPVEFLRGHSLDLAFDFAAVVAIVLLLTSSRAPTAPVLARNLPISRWRRLRFMTSSFPLDRRYGKCVTVGTHFTAYP